jgi:hypothetical protein
MIDLSTENKNLCFEDSTQKPLYIFLYYWQGEQWQHFHTIDKAIVLESMEVEEGVLESDHFELGSFVVPSIKVKWENNGISYKNMLAIPVQQIGNEYVAYFEGAVLEEENSNDGKFVTAKISSFLSQKLDVDVLPYVKEKSGRTLSFLVANVFEHLGVEEVRTWLHRLKNANERVTLNENTLPEKLTFVEFIKQVCEFLGCHVFLKEKRVVSNLHDMETYHPIGKAAIGFCRLSKLNNVLKTQNENLPSPYKRLPYIQTIGSGYIMTDYIPNDKTSVELEFYNFAQYKSPVDPNNPILDTTALFGSRSAFRENSFCCFLSNQRLNAATVDFGSERVEFDASVLRFSKFTLKNGEATVDDARTSLELQEFNGDTPLAIFTVNTSGEVDERCAKGKLYYFKVFEDDVLKLNLIPCIDTTNYGDSIYYCGLYDTISGNFYRAASGGTFIAPNPVETHTLPYHINLYTDKTKTLSIDQIRVVTDTGDPIYGTKNFRVFWEDNPQNTYEIKNNIFFEGLNVEYGWEYCEKAVEEVASYLSDLDFYFCDLKTVYPPFIEGGDYLLIPHKNQKRFSNGFTALQSIKFKSDLMLSKYPRFDFGRFFAGNPIAFKMRLSFSILGDTSKIIENLVQPVSRKRSFDITYVENSLEVNVGEYIVGFPTFVINNVPKNQRINLEFIVSENTCVYSGTYNGTVEINNYSNEGNVPLALGSNGIATDFEIYEFVFEKTQTNIVEEYVPCLNSNNEIGFYLFENGKSHFFYKPQIIGEQEIKYGGYAVPVLSCFSKGIHSMIADISCKATDIKN